MTSNATDPLDPRPAVEGLRVAPFRGLRPRADGAQLAARLCPPYDVIDAALRAELVTRDAANAVQVILPEPTAAGYEHAAQVLDRWVADGLVEVDDVPTLYVYEMREPDGHVTRGLLAEVELRDPADGVILPHENTMAGPVADRLAVMTATGTDLEPIYLVYDGGGAASALVRDVDGAAPTAEATTPDGITHRLWLVTDASTQRAAVDDLATRRALIADGHHRYATYRERQRLRRTDSGPGPWDNGLALIVDTSDYGPQVHAIHRVVTGDLSAAVAALDPDSVTPLNDATANGLDRAVDGLATLDGFAAVLTDGTTAFQVHDPSRGVLRDAAPPANADETPEALTQLDVTLVHRGLVESVWRLRDDEQTVGYAHSVAEAVAQAREGDGFAILLRPTPVAAVAAVAAAGGRMPRKSTLFTPKPASGLVMRRLADQSG